MQENNQIELSVVIPTLNEEKNIARCLKSINEILSKQDFLYEIIIVDGKSTDDTVNIAKTNGAKVLIQKNKGFGCALSEAFSIIRGRYVLTIDADFSHNPAYIPDFLKERNSADIIIGSRYVKGGKFEITLWRKLISILVNYFFSKLLSIPAKDLSGNYRLYKSEVVKETKSSSVNYDFLQDILIKAYSKGFTIKEIPIHYIARNEGQSKLSISRFFKSYVKTFLGLYKIRHSSISADYDYEAYNSAILLQRWWQRKRVKTIINLCSDSGRKLDIACGSSRSICNINNIIGLDLNYDKLRFLKNKGVDVVQASVFNLPFKKEVFNTVICSELIEHIPKEQVIFDELNRILKNKGKLVLGTPDYSKRTWRVIEFLYSKILPNSYAEEHISHYTKEELFKKLNEMKYKIKQYYYILHSELIIDSQKE